MIGQEGSPIEIAKQEIGPCYSRWADDCFELSSKQLQERGLYANCEQLIQAKEMSSAEDWNSYINEIPYCDGYFAYDRMPDGRGEGTGRKKTKDNTALAVGAGVAVVVLGLLAIA